jgi:RNA polymerase sigma factor (sigma-70 family)
VVRYERLVYSTLRRFRLSNEDIEDAFQATFIALFKALDQIETIETLPRWIAVSASRSAIAVLRKAPSREVEGAEFLEELPDEVADPEQIAISSCDAFIVQEAFGDLEERCKELLTRSFISEESYQEISEKMTMSVGSIGPTRARCLERLRKLFEKRGGQK